MINNSRRIPTEFMRVDEARVTPGYRFALRRGRVGFEAIGQFVRVAAINDQSPTQLATPFGLDRARNEFELATHDFRLSYAFIERTYREDAEGRPVLGVRLEPRVGVRLVDFRSSIELLEGPGTGLIVEDSATTLEPIVGIAAAATLHDRLSLELGADVGGFIEFGDVSSSSANLEVTGRWHATRHLDVEVGYRFLLQDVADPPGIDLDGSVAGAFIGIGLRF